MTTVPKPLFVAIVNDCPVVVLGVTALLRPFGRLVRIASYVDRFPQRGRADIVLYDPFVDPNTLGQMHAIVHQTGARVLAFTTATGEAQIDRAMQVGASGVLSKTVDGATMLVALETAAADHSMGLVADPAPTKPRWPGEQDGLNARESAVIALVVVGMSNQDIANTIGMSILTVKIHIRSAYTKMGVTSRAQAVSWGVHHDFQFTTPVVRLDERGQ